MGNLQPQQFVRPRADKTPYPRDTTACLTLHSLHSQGCSSTTSLLSQVSPRRLPFSAASARRLPRSLAAASRAAPSRTTAASCAIRHATAIQSPAVGVPAPPRGCAARVLDPRSPCLTVALDSEHCQSMHCVGRETCAQLLHTHATASPCKPTKCAHADRERVAWASCALQWTQ